MKAPPPHKRSAGNKAAVKHKRTYNVCLNESSQHTRATGRSQPHSCAWEKREESNTPCKLLVESSMKAPLPVARSRGRNLESQLPT